MGYADLRECVNDLEKHGELVRVDEPIDPCLEMACIQRLAFQAQSPAILFTRPKGCRFPMLANLFGTSQRLHFIFRDSIEKIGMLFAARADPGNILKKPLRHLSLLAFLRHLLPRYVRGKIPVLANQCRLKDLPQLVSWPEDGGAFITLPLVYSEDPEDRRKHNLGMYRVQISGNNYEEKEAGMHYQLQRGMGIHHAKALGRGERLYVNVAVGGPPALALAAVMPLPEGMGELLFAGLLGGRRMELGKGSHLPILAQCDFVIQGYLDDAQKPEGPFGDHLGYYSLKHDFPVLKVLSVHHRDGAIWPFTSVGRPPQEDTIFGDFIHECTGPLTSQVFPGISQLHAVDVAGVHPLLLAVGSERYVPWHGAEKPVELLTLAMHLLGNTQTALAKYVLIAQDAPGLSCRDVKGFLVFMLEHTDFQRDLHFITKSACDTLDYSGYDLNEGSRLIWAACRKRLRTAGTEMHALPRLPEGFCDPQIVMPGVLAISGPANRQGRLEHEPCMLELAKCFSDWSEGDGFPLIVVVDDARFCAKSLENFIWITFTRTDPARDIYGTNATVNLRHWGFRPPIFMDARMKPGFAPPLEDDPAVLERVKNMAKRGGPLHGLIRV